MNSVNVIQLCSFPLYFYILFAPVKRLQAGFYDMSESKAQQNSVYTRQLTLTPTLLPLQTSSSSLQPHIQERSLDVMQPPRPLHGSKYPTHNLDRCSGSSAPVHPPWSTTRSVRRKTMKPQLHCSPAGRVACSGGRGRHENKWGNTPAAV